MAKATLWKRAIAIAHQAIDEWPTDSASQAEAFKQHCADQGLPYAERSPDNPRPLYVRALEAAHMQRRRRKVANG